MRFARVGPNKVQLSTVSVARPASQPAAVTPTTRARINASFAALPLAFEANEGQTDPRVKYMARGNGYTLFLTSGDAVLSFASASSSVQSRPKEMMQRRLLGYSRKTKRLIRRSQPQSRPIPLSSILHFGARTHLTPYDEATARVREPITEHPEYSDKRCRCEPSPSASRSPG